MSQSAENDRIAQAIRDHRLQPRIRSNDAAPAEDYECLCSEMFWGVAEWSQHVASCVLPPERTCLCGSGEVPGRGGCSECR